MEKAQGTMVAPRPADIVEWLRDSHCIADAAGFSEDIGDSCKEAADEIERLREQLAFSDMGWRNQTHMVDILQARLDKGGQGQGQATWAGLVQENAALRAEVERLQECNDTLASIVADDETPALRDKLEAAREALRSIASNTCCDRCQEAALVARAALTKQEERE